MSTEPFQLKQMRNEAIDMLVLWAASKEYSAVSHSQGDLPPSARHENLGCRG